MILTERLRKVAEYVNNSDCLADIGTDHGYVPIFCVTQGRAKTAVASDISIGPLNIAQKNIEKYLLSDKISTRISNGFENFEKGSFDTAVIAGMGGLLINEILENGKRKFSDKTHIILQPMIAQSEVRRYLSNNGFIIEKENLAKEGNKIYNIFLCKKGVERLSEFDIYVGKRLLEDKNPLFLKYIDGKIRTLEKIINGLKKAENSAYELDMRKKELGYYLKARNEF